MVDNHDNYTGDAQNYDYLFDKLLKQSFIYKDYCDSQKSVYGSNTNITSSSQSSPLPLQNTNNMGPMLFRYYSDYKILDANIFIRNQKFLSSSTCQNYNMSLLREIFISNFLTELINAIYIHIEKFLNNQDFMIDLSSIFDFKIENSVFPFTDKKIENIKIYVHKKENYLDDARTMTIKIQDHHKLYLRFHSYLDVGVAFNLKIKHIQIIYTAIDFNYSTEMFLFWLSMFQNKEIFAFIRFLDYIECENCQEFKNENLLFLKIPIFSNTFYNLDLPQD